jgi:hypothetical protein
LSERSDRVDPEAADAFLLWHELTPETRDLLRGKLAGLWGAADDQQAFDRLSTDKQEALLLFARRLNEKNLWPAVRRIENVYGLSGVGMDFRAWPFLASVLTSRGDFTRRFARHRPAAGGFYEKGRHDAALHFLYQDSEPRIWHVHFDLYSPVRSLRSAVKHLRHEYFGKVTPDWRQIKRLTIDN